METLLILKNMTYKKDWMDQLIKQLKIFLKKIQI